jgi:alpha-tubulin suppressor-like RCC1 family protein
VTLLVIISRQGTSSHSSHSSHCCLTHVTLSRNKFGQLGLGHTNDEVTPRVVESLAGQPVSLLSCGWRHTMAVTRAGQVYAWGRGVNGEGGCVGGRA